MVPPLVVDVDGTLTRPKSDGIDPRVFDPLREWGAPVVVATGKAFPYPVALCHFAGIEERVVAENGGLVLVDGRVTERGDGERTREAFRAFEAAGGDAAWDLEHTANRWRETEVAVPLEADERLLREVAADHDVTVVDTGYAYHLVTPGVDKGRGLETAADALGRDPGTFVAVGDSENDVPAFRTAGRSFAVANADRAAREAADVVVDGRAADGFLSVLDRL